MMADKVRMINAEKLKRQLIEGDGHDDDRFTEGYNFAINEVRGYIADMPTVEAQPVKHGYWKSRLSTPDSMKCSVCGNSSIMWERYCPHCGARMDGDSDEL